MNIQNNGTDALEKKHNSTEVKNQTIKDRFISLLGERAADAVFVACTAFIKQYRLDRKYDAAYVLNEAYLRACRLHSESSEIGNLHTWLILTCRYIVMELNHAEKKDS